MAHDKNVILPLFTKLITIEDQVVCHSIPFYL